MAAYARMRFPKTLPGVLVIALCGACVAVEEERAPVVEAEAAEAHARMSGDGVFYVMSANAERPYVRYADGQLSQNQSCAIKLGNKLNRRVPPMFINGQPIGFC